MVNTILGACGAGLTVLVINKKLGGTWSYLMTLNGALTGMVVMCGGCNAYQPWAAILCGAIGGVGFVLTHFVMLKMQLDDPLDAVGVHGTGGLIGVICVPIFSYETGIIYNISANSAWVGLGVNLLGLIAIIAWSAVWSVAIFLPLKLLNAYRIDEETEALGNDMIKHGEAAYPAEAWVEMQVQYFNFIL